MSSVWCWERNRSAALASASKPLASSQKNRVRLTTAVAESRYVVQDKCRRIRTHCSRRGRTAPPRYQLLGQPSKRQPRRHRRGASNKHGAVAQHACLRAPRGSPAAPRRRHGARGPGEHHIPKHLAPRPAITNLQPQHVLIKGHRRHSPVNKHGLLYWEK